MDEATGALWGACDTQPIQHVGVFNSPDIPASLLPYHAETPFPWGSEPWDLPSRSDDITLMSSSLVNDVPAYDSVMNLPRVSEDVHDLVGGNSKFRQNGQWGQPEFTYSAQDPMQDLMNNQFIQYNSPVLASNHLPQNFATLDCPQGFNNKSFGTINPTIHNGAVPTTNVQNSQYRSPLMVPNCNPVTSTDVSITQCGVPSVPSQTAQYGGSSMVSNSMEMFGQAATRGIMITSGLVGGCNPNLGLMHLAKQQHAHSLPPSTNRDVSTSEVGSRSSVPNVAGGSFNSSQKGSASVMMSSLAASSHMHKMDAVSEEPKLVSFNPGPYVPAQKQQQSEQQDTLSNRIWADKTNQGKISSSPIPIMGFEPRQQQAMSKSSPVSNLGFEHGRQAAMSNSSSMNNMGFEQQMQQPAMSNSSVTNLGFEQQRQQQAMSSSSPVTSLGFDPRLKQPMGSSPSVTIIGFDQRRKQPVSSSPSKPIMEFDPSQKQPLSSPSPLSNMVFEQRQLPTMGSSPPISISGFESRQQPSVSNSPPLSNLGFEQRQQSTVSNSPPLSNLGFEQRQHQPMSNASSISNMSYEQQRNQPALCNASPISTLPFEQQRQQSVMSNPRSAKPDSGESVTKWPLRMDGGLGGCVGLPGNQKAPVMMQPETGTIKCPIPRNMPGSAKIGPAVQNSNPVLKRPLTVDDKKDQGGSMNKKPMQKALGPQGCSRLESISALAHQKVSQSASGRALGPALNTNLKPRARQGSANDPQSIAARVRRERISERLKVLQALIPNGDKVDMVTMLEKAITYVQCLELQIKMLKNDSIWPKALGPLPNTLQELLELAGPEFSGTESKNVEEPPAKPKKSAPDVIEFDGNQPSADKE
ncbi:uncharacterized protein [Physcomitrium patens]|uniref:BHLH domain-containing protein n=2 Tax=Physcomitrium patens TaxID=3218 RepID=A0A2K1L0R4_PHYPA|nr:mediator of RNA polymerase II transcription subunit 15-like isoform X1 [Physcomitrium patens]PNR59612.1 hypothetical protein PHYPA_002404 [Physcomitrium patens]|eukprot:XP_024361920.1 mediator of RNA polymerase II transcription subunit 15-like isoform X1 [Physcomitrella patens]